MKLSLVTCVDLGDKISIISDGQMTGINEDNIIGDSFKKFVVKDDYFIAITNSYIVANEIFKRIQNENCTAKKTRKLIDEIFEDLNKEFILLIGMMINNELSYAYYTHINGVYNQGIVSILDNPCVVLHSGNFDVEVVNNFKKKITSLKKEEASSDIIINVQKQFHFDVEKIDYTVNDNLFHEVFIK